jgi:NAD(P)-dependent dehydrogenase (short-subunit alcohol dehydrogenase family)
MSSPTSPYAEAHANPHGEGDARPTALQIIHDEDLVNKLSDKVMLVTGSSSGIGVETVRALHATGAYVFMQVRDMTKGETVQKDILASSEGKGKLELLYMELGSFASIRKGVQEFLEKSGGKLNVLVNNAGTSLLPDIPFRLNHFSILIIQNLTEF